MDGNAQEHPITPSAVTNRKFIAACLLVAGLASSTPAQIVKTPKGYLFRVKYVVGATLKYSSLTWIDNKSSTPPPVGTAKIPIVYHVVDVTKSLATIKLTVGPTTLPPSTAVVSEATTISLQMDNRNRTVSGQAPPGVGSFSDKPIQSGSTWESAIPFKVFGHLQRLSGVYRFAGVKPNTTIAVVTYSLTGAAFGTGTMLMSTKDGSMISNDAFISVQGPSGIYRFHIAIKRVP